MTVFSMNLRRRRERFSNLLDNLSSNGFALRDVVVMPAIDAREFSSLQEVISQASFDGFPSLRWYTNLLSTPSVLQLVIWWSEFRLFREMTRSNDWALYMLDDYELTLSPDDFEILINDKIDITSLILTSSVIDDVVFDENSLCGSSGGATLMSPDFVAFKHAYNQSRQIPYSLEGFTGEMSKNKDKNRLNNFTGRSIKGGANLAFHLDQDGVTSNESF